jgi:hypothetical protein
MPMFALFALIATASAGPGHYHPADVAAQSSLYARAADGAGVTFAKRTEDVERIARALRDYEEGLDLLGSRAAPAERERLASLQKSYHRDVAVISAFANTMMEDFDGVFSAAMERAIAAQGEASECASLVQSGPAVPGIPPRMEKNTACEGPDLNGTIGSAMDADPLLISAVDEILALEWPALRTDTEAQAPVGSGTAWLDVDAFFRKVAKDALRKIDSADEDARLDFQAAIEEGAATSELEGHVSAAKKITAQTAARRADLAAGLLQAIDDRAAKKGWSVAWCANPSVLGGCTGEDAGDDMVANMLADKKVQKALP